MKTIKGLGIYFTRFARDTWLLRQPGGNGRLGRRPRVQGRAEVRPSRRSPSTAGARPKVARREGRAADPASLLAPSVEDVVQGMRFVAAAAASTRADGRWTAG